MIQGRLGQGRLGQQRLGETFQVIVDRYHYQMAMIKTFPVTVSRKTHLTDSVYQHLNNDVHEWLAEIGFENWDITVRAQITFYFKYEEDKVKFILKWL